AVVSHRHSLALADELAQQLLQLGLARSAQATRLQESPQCPMGLKLLGSEEPRRTCDVLTPAREALVEQRPYAMAQEVARESFVGIAFILDPRESALARIGEDRLARDVEKRPQELHRPERSGARHAARAGRTGAAQQVEKHRLGLVVEMMGEHDRVGAQPFQDLVAR